MLYLKSCTRCKGDMYLDKDGYGAFISCLQCGFTRDLPSSRPPEPAISIDMMSDGEEDGTGAPSVPEQAA
jgi:hypothetical protein